MHFWLLLITYVMHFLRLLIAPFALVGHLLFVNNFVSKTWPWRVSSSKVDSWTNAMRIWLTNILFGNKISIWRKGSLKDCFPYEDMIDKFLFFSTTKFMHRLDQLLQQSLKFTPWIRACKSHSSSRQSVQQSLNSHSSERATLTQQSERATLTQQSLKFTNQSVLQEYSLFCRI